jgi:uncharacterized protein YuzE
MKLNYDPETDSLYIDLSEKPSVDSREIAEDIVVDFDAEGHVVGLDIQHASRNLAMDSLGTISFPVKKLKVA